MSKKYEYTLADCQCCYCLHYDPKTQDCEQDICCCLEEKRVALSRLSFGSFAEGKISEGHAESATKAETKDDPLVRLRREEQPGAEKCRA